MMNEYTLTVGAVASLLAVAAFPFMLSQQPRRMMAGALLAVPFIAFMAVITFAR